MEQKPNRSMKYTFPYLVLGLVIAFFLVVIASAFALVYQGKAVTLSNLFALHTTLGFLIVDLIALYSALVFGLVGYQKDRAEESRRYADWYSQNQHKEIAQVQEAQTEKDKKYQVEIARLNDQNANQKTQFQELEAIIHRGKQQWEATFDALEDLIILTDEKGMIIRCNRATGQIFHLGFSQIIGRGIDELFANDTISLRGTIPGEKKELKLTRSEIWYEVSKSHLLIDGRQEGWVYIFRNITIQKQAFRDQQRLTQYYEILVNNSPVAIVTLNQEGRIIDCNPAFESLFQYTKKEAIGSTVNKLITPSNLTLEANGMEDAVRKGIKVQSITQRVRKDGLLLDVEMYGIPVVLNGKQVGSLDLYHDISSLVQPQRAAPEAAVLAAAGMSDLAKPESETELEEEIPVVEMAPEEQSALAQPAIVEEVPEQPEMEAAGQQAMEEGEPQVEQEPEPTQPEEFERPAEEAPAPIEGQTRLRKIPVEKIEGIGPVYSRKLGEVGIKTTNDLLSFGKNRKGREELVEKTGISALLVLKWVNMADLMRIQGVGEEYSELLEKAGVDTVKELRNRNPENLLAAITQANGTYKLVRRLPSLSDVESWVKEAKESEPIMTY